MNCLSILFVPSISSRPVNLINRIPFSSSLYSSFIIVMTFSVSRFISMDLQRLFLKQVCHSSFSLFNTDGSLLHHVLDQLQFNHTLSHGYECLFQVAWLPAQRFADACSVDKCFPVQ